MVKIKAFKNLLDEIQTAVEGIDVVILTPTEEHAIKKISQVTTGVVLIGVIPSADADTPDSDNYGDSNTSFLFVVEKMNHNIVTDESELDSYEKTQDIIAGIKVFILAEKESCDMLRHANLDSLHVDPEYNSFGGYNGWSLALTFETNGY